MVLNPEQFNFLGHAAPNVEMPTVVASPSRRKWGGAKRSQNPPADAALHQRVPPVARRRGV